MGDVTDSNRACRFGVFEVDLAARELRKSGVRIKLQDQPFRVLALLLERPGEIVKHEELPRAIWSQATLSNSTGTQHWYPGVSAVWSKVPDVRAARGQFPDLEKRQVRNRLRLGLCQRHTGERKRLDIQA